MGGMIKSATTIDPKRAQVLVKAKGRNSLPSSPIMLNTGRNPTTVVATAVRIAEATSVVAV